MYWQYIVAFFIWSVQKEVDMSNPIGQMKKLNQKGTQFV